MSNKFKIGDIAIAESNNLLTGYTCGKSYEVLPVCPNYIEILTDYNRYEQVPAIFFSKG
ncbi:hypothetical protein VP193E371_P0111 [Vibrio phage 193E37-1]|nr:hypothetical protein VP193E371_P0111 [Vibrio phage 193E37-1]